MATAAKRWCVLAEISDEPCSIILTVFAQSKMGSVGQSLLTRKLVIEHAPMSVKRSSCKQCANIHPKRVLNMFEQLTSPVWINRYLILLTMHVLSFNSAALVAVSESRLCRPNRLSFHLNCVARMHRYQLIQFSCKRKLTMCVCICRRMTLGVCRCILACMCGCVLLKHAQPV